MPSANDPYLHGHHDSVLRSHRWRTAENSAGYLLAHLPGTAQVLDVGCGPAHLARGLLARGVGYVGVDRNAAMVSRAGRRVASSPGQGVVVRADVTALPFRAESFDIVVAAGVLGLLDLDSRHAALREMARVVRGEVRLLEPVRRAGAPPRTTRSRLIALVRVRPVDLAELAAAGLCTRIEVYKHAGYFEPGQASELKALVHRSNVTHPPAIVRRFVQRYAHSAPSGAQAKPRPAGRRFPGRPVAVSSTYALRAGLRMAITSACKRSPQASAAIAHYGVRLAGLLPLGWCSTVVSEEGKNTLSWPSRQRTR